MAKGSGRRRITPADGLKYDEETGMTSIESVSKSFEGMKYFMRSGYRTGAQPTAESWYGSNGKRWGGNGRKNDNRNWKTNRDEQYAE